MLETLASLQVQEVEYLRDLVENVNDLVQSVRPDGSFLYVNRAWCETFGYTRAEVAQLSVFAVIHPQSREHCQDVFRGVLAGEQFDAVESTFVTKAGQDVVMEASVNRRFQDCQPVATRTILRNITERKRVEAVFRESQRQSQLIFDTSLDAIVVMDQEGTITAWNPQAEAIFGWPRAEVLGRSVADTIIPLQFRDAHRQGLRHYLATGEGPVLNRRIEIVARHRDGHEFPVELTIAPLRSGDRVAFSGFLRDISDRKRAEERFRQVWNNSGDGLRLTDADGVVVMVNDAFCRMVELPRETLVGETLAIIQPAESRERVLRHHHERFANRMIPSRMERELPLWNGKRTWFELTNTLLPGDQPLLLSIFRDITERKRAEEERRTLEAQLQHAQKLESLGVLAGGIAHDFNNLLTSILGYASLGLMELPDESNAYPLLREIEKAAQRAADLTQQMLAYSGRGKFVIQPLRLDTVVQEMTQLLGTVVSKKATLNRQLEPATIEGDATQIRQVVMNLMTNASEALDGQCGSITVRTGVRQLDAAVLRSPFFPEGLPAGAYAYAYVEVEDTGCGMSDETRGRIFDPFFTTKFTGRGLGLAAVLGIIKGHHGTIKVDSAPGRGTTFQVLFPRSTPIVSESQVVGPNPALPRGQGLVLIVDDELSVRSFIRRVLETVGFQVREAVDGREGLDLCRRYHEELVVVLLDLTMPHMDGLEVLGELRRDHPAVPVLVMSGYSEQEVAKRFAGLGVNGFIQKPFYPRDLIARVCQCGERHRAR